MPQERFHVFNALKRRWRLYRDPIGFARSLGVQIGDDCRLIAPTMETFGSEPYLIQLGDHVTVAGGVRFITHDGGVWVFRQKHPDIDVVAPITIGNNVFVGAGAILTPGVTIGDNCVIGAGSIVTKDVPADCVAAGVPARVIKTLDAYWEGISSKAVFVRSLSIEEKRRIFLQIAATYRSDRKEQGK